MGKYSDFPSQAPQMRPKFAIYIPKRDDGHLRHFYIGVLPPPPTSPVSREIYVIWTEDNVIPVNKIQKTFVLH